MKLYFSLNICLSILKYNAKINVYNRSKICHFKNVQAWKYLQIKTSLCAKMASVWTGPYPYNLPSFSFIFLYPVSNSTHRPPPADVNKDSRPGHPFMRNNLIRKKLSLNKPILSTFDYSLPLSVALLLLLLLHCQIKTKATMTGSKKLH